MTFCKKFLWTPPTKNLGQHFGFKNAILNGRSTVHARGAQNGIKYYSALCRSFVRKPREMYYRLAYFKVEVVHLGGCISCDYKREAGLISLAYIKHALFCCKTLKYSTFPHNNLDSNPSSFMKYQKYKSLAVH